MKTFSSESFLNQKIHGLDFQFIIGDIEGYLKFSEIYIEWQLRRELMAIKRQAAVEKLSQEHLDHLETNAKHHFIVSILLRVRYGRLIAFITSVKWAIESIRNNLADPLPRVRKKESK
ncbi:hypothetical protein DJ030_07570 [bacterium endosymbiont of Escarpia laminata]|nr:MAG: hypothetical protein DJ030_07570 [bacterium endosymbiont of Escarpia laminata]